MYQPPSGSPGTDIEITIDDCEIKQVKKLTYLR